jgi:hypothetical protein
MNEKDKISVDLKSESVKVRLVLAAQVARAGGVAIA